MSSLVVNQSDRWVTTPVLIEKLGYLLLWDEFATNIDRDRICVGEQVQDRWMRRVFFC